MRIRPDSLVFGLAVGLLVAFVAHRWVTAPEQTAERIAEEQAVLAARQILAGRLDLIEPEIVDPVSPRRQVGKTYVYPAADGWEVSGYYRRDARDPWHDWLMRLDADLELVHLKVRDDDPRTRQRGERDAALEVLR